MLGSKPPAATEKNKEILVKYTEKMGTKNKWQLNYHEDLISLRIRLQILKPATCSLTCFIFV
jgi:hypothetical protein